MSQVAIWNVPTGMFFVPYYVYIWDTRRGLPPLILPCVSLPR